MDMKKTFQEPGNVRVLGYSLSDGCEVICNVQFDDRTVKAVAFPETRD